MCALMRRERPGCEPSHWRVTTLVLEYLPEIVRSMGRRDKWWTLMCFEKSLWREGVNPNPGRPFTATVYTLELGWEEAHRVGDVNA